MRKDARQFKVNPCVLCGYLFSDKHHLYPQREGTGGETLYLCPNHHRYANMVQAMIEQDVSTQNIIAFGAENFDALFDARVINVLVRKYNEGLIDHLGFGWAVDLSRSMRKRGKNGR